MGEHSMGGLFVGGKSSQFSLEYKLQRFAVAVGPSKPVQQAIYESFTWLYEQVLSHYPYLLEAKISGALAMNTMLSDEHMVDVELLLEPKFFDITPSSVLRKLYKDLLHAYQSAQLDLAQAAIIVSSQNKTFRLLVRVCVSGETYYPDANGIAWLKMRDILSIELRFCDADISLQGRLSELTRLIKYWAAKHHITHDDLLEIEEVVMSLCCYDASLRSGLQLLLLYFNWQDENCSSQAIECMDDTEFAIYCHQRLLGQEFV